MEVGAEDWEELDTASIIALNEPTSMNKLGKTLRIFLFFAILIAGAYSLWCAVGYLTLPAQTRSLVIPVLNAAFDNRDTNEDQIRLEDRLEVVLKDRSDSGDRAIAFLAQYYLGEHNGEEITINITQRGKRVLPYLEQYRNHAATVPRPEFFFLRLSRSERAWFNDHLIGLVREGKVLEE